MPVIYRTDGAWGVGKGSNLAPAEVDGNFHDLAGRVSYIEDNPVLPIAPISITIAGYNFYMGLSNGEMLGPVTMTMPVPQWRGDWTPSTIYNDMDYIIAPDGGFGTVMQSHTSAATFDWAATDPDNGLPLYRLIVGSNGMTIAYSDLTDVALSSLANHDMPVWDSAAGYWRNATPAQVVANLAAFTGDSGSGGVKGLVPAPAVGDAAAGKVLGAGGAWVVVSGGGAGGVTGPGSSVNNNLAAFNGTSGGAIKDSGIAIANVVVMDGALGTPASGSAANLTSIPVNRATGILGATHGGAGSVTGLLKANGLGNVSAAVPGTDYALPGATGASVTIGDTPPGSPAPGDLWFDSGDTITLYVWMDDGTSSQWIPACNCAVSGGSSDFLALSGGSMTGPLILAGDPTTALGAATKQFVESRGYITGNQTITLSGDISGSGTTSINATLATVPISKGGSGQTSLPAAFNSLAAAGGTVGGDLTVNGNITVNPTAGNALSYNVPNGQDARIWYTVLGTRTWGSGVYSSGEWFVMDNSVPANRLLISPTGVCSASSTWGVISDRRLKQSDSIEEYSKGLQEILALNPIYYQWNGKGGVPADGQIHFGLAAQDVEKVLPELIREHEYVPPEGSDDEPMTIKTYSPTDITFALVNAIKELQKQIEELKAALPLGVRP
jgi:hypothetical protein